MTNTSKHIVHLPRSSVAELLGWLGAAAILIDYALLSFDILDGSSLIYHLIFILGSAGLVVVTYRHRAFQSVVVNLIFITIGIVAVIRIVLLS